MYNKNKLLILCVVIILFSNPLYGYLDPGTFTYLASVIVGALVGILMYIKIIWAKIMQLVHKIRNREITNEDD